MVAAVGPAGQAELRRSLAGPLATVVVAHLLGLSATPPQVILGWYDAIVAAVSELAGAPRAAPAPAGSAAFGQLVGQLREVIAADRPRPVAAGRGGPACRSVRCGRAEHRGGGVQRGRAVVRRHRDH